jgi:hypothetical protein
MNGKKTRKNRDNNSVSASKMEKVIAIDPGPEHSGLVVWNGETIETMFIKDNDEILSYLRNLKYPPQYAPDLVIEKIASYGMPVSESIFETVYWTGRFTQVYCGNVYRIPRMKVKMHLCHSSRARDSHIRQALIDRFGAPGTKKNPGLTYGLKKDLWQAFALSVTYYDLYINKGGT